MSFDDTMIVSGSADESIKIWRVESKQCLGTISMRGPIMNLLLRTVSRQFNSPDFHPKSVLKDFQKRYDEFQETLTIYCPEDIEVPCDDNSDDGSHSDDLEFESNESKEIVKLRNQLEKEKRINKELFGFIQDKILGQEDIELEISGPSKIERKLSKPDKTKPKRRKTKVKKELKLKRKKIKNKRKWKLVYLID